MNGGTIYDCKTASTWSGGGVYIYDYSKFIMNGGAIRNCSAFIGGGVSYTSGVEFTMNGGAIYDCTDTSGSGTSAIDGYKMYANGGTVKGTVDLSSCEISETGSAVGTKFYDKVKCITISGGVFYGEINGNPTITGTDYSISFNLNGGSGSIPTQRFINTSTATALKPTDPTREGYIFTGWYNGTEKYEFNVPVTENTTLNAKWVSGNLTSESDFMQALEAGVTSVKLKNNISLSDTLDLSHRNFTLDLNGFTLTGNIKFKNDRNRYTISDLTLTDSSATGTGVLNGNIEIGGGTVANTTSYLIADGGTVTGTVTMPDGYNGGTITCGKNTPTAFKGDVDAGKYGNITGGIFYGKIIESGLGCINALEVTYNIGDDRYALMVRRDQPVIAPIEPTVPQGKKFTGWYKDKEFKNKYTFGNSESSDITLYAGIEDITYKVNYKSGADGNGSIATGTKIYGTDYKLTDETFTRDGFVQIGWSDTEGGNKIYELGGTYTSNADVTLYPVWDEIITITVPFTTKVELGDNTKPEKTEFVLELIGANTAEENYAVVTVAGTVETDGEGSYNGTLSLTGPSQQIYNMLCEGAFFGQKNTGKANWTYDDTVWALVLNQGAAACDADSADDGVWSVLIYPTLCEETDNGKYYTVDSDGALAEKMTFTNTYTEHTHKYAQKHNDKEHFEECICGDKQNTETHKYGEWNVTKKADENTEGEKEHTCSVCGYTETANIEKLPKAESPKTGDNSRALLWFALALISGGLIAATAIYRKMKKHSAR